MEYVIHLIILINIYIILTTSSNLLVGLTNLLSLGQAALYGIGAYLSVLALMVFHWPLIPTLLFSMIITSLLSLLLAWPSLRLKGDYFVLATLGFQLIVFTILYNWVSVTRGPYGIPGIPAPKLLNNIEISGLWAFFVLSLVLVVVVVFLFHNLIHSPFGRALKGIRDDELSMQALGKNVTALKIQAFVISSAFIAISGFLYATYVSYIDPTSFNLDESIFILSALIVGGLGNIRGPVIGALVVILLPEALRFIGLPDSVAANMRQIIYGLALIVLMRFRPQGIAGNYSIK
ncbi:MAG: branched-chain amino acid ABC transporter permease [Bacteroidales bacterium]|nr:branched-chain amino acid ABC transporter permease [Bacteroidales bacterium]